MKKSFLSAIVLLSVTLFIFGCAAQTKLADYQPKSEEEKEVFEFISECDAAFQNKNMTKYAACFHEDAEIRVYWGDLYSIRVVSKDIFWEDGLSDGRGAFMGGLKILNPKITVNGDKAIMKYTEGAWEYGPLPAYWDLVKENGQWYITKYDWKVR